MSETRLRDELCRVGRSLHARGYVHGTTGNLSARLHDGFLITATDACLGDLEPAALVKVDAAGHAAAGAGRPSKTLALHRRIYEAAAEAGCIVHTHSRALVALSLAIPADEDRDDLLPPITPYFVMKVGHVPLLAYAPPGRSGVADRVAAAIARRRAARRADPRRHAGAPRPERLGRNAGRGHGAARGARGNGAPVARRDAEAGAACRRSQIEELRRQFGARW